MQARGAFALLLLIAMAPGLLFLRPASAASSGPIVDLDDAAHRTLSADRDERREAIEWLLQSDDRGAVAVLIQLLRWRPDEEAAMVAHLERLTGAKAGLRWFDWMVWQQEHPEIAPYGDYDGFLSDFLAGIDPNFRRFVHRGVPRAIRIEEIVWGGVGVNGIPALDDPKLIDGSGATYLNPNDTVFGIEIDGDARAYPLRIVNWHEMVNDVVGGVPVSLAYCTLCGAGILFDDRVVGHGERFSFGSSGLLYRSNKLMYDRQTASLWDQFTGQPVVGPLVGSGIELKVLPVALTTWQQWRARHPATRVLSLDTGYQRDYGPGVAYHDYFASPDLLFPAFFVDHRLSPKDLIFGVRVPGGVKAWPLADFAEGVVINDRVGFVDVVLIGDPLIGGARAYRADGHRFARGASPEELVDADGGRWRVTEDDLIGPKGEHLPRLPGHVAYWFAWSGFFEDAELGGAPR
jgi:Protein of unknown function (DUF3179)